MLDLEAQITIKRNGQEIELTVGATASPFTQSLELETDGGIEDVQYVLDSLGQPWYGELTHEERNKAFAELRSHLEEASEPNLDWGEF